jgi:hypothetical protein
MFTARHYKVKMFIRLAALEKSWRLMNPSSGRGSIIEEHDVKDNGFSVEWNKIMFLEIVTYHTKETLNFSIHKYIEPGTTIISDCWSAYDSTWLVQLGFYYMTVNHSQFFKDPITGAHTNSIEGTWMHVKRSLNKNGIQKALLDNYFTKVM